MVFLAFGSCTVELAKLESSNELELVVYLVVVHTLCYLGLLCKFDELGQDVVAFGAVAGQLVVGVSLEDVGSCLEQGPNDCEVPSVCG